MHLNFLDLPKELANYEFAQVVVLSLPYEATTTYGKGTERGPRAIIAASHQVEWYDEELDLEPCQVGISTQQPISDFGTAEVKAIQRISEQCEKFLQHDKFVVGLGGEHTVSVGMVQAFKKYHPDMWVLQLDAHSDLRQEYHQSRLNHACVMARISEICPFIGVGIRSTGSRDSESLPASCAIFYAHELHKQEDWFALVDKHLGQNVYLTIDLDFFDPAAVPAVGTPEPGGFHWYETLDFLKEIIRTRNVIGFDIVELSPQNGLPVSDFFAAKLLYKLIGYIFAGNSKKTAKKSLDS